MSQLTIEGVAAILAELGRGYTYCQRFRIKESLAGVTCGEEGAPACWRFNFVLKVVHAATGFNDPETRAGYYRNVLEFARLDRELESPTGAVTLCASCQPDGRGPCLCVAPNAEIHWEVMLGVADLSDGYAGSWKAEKIIVQAPRTAGLETLEGLAIEVFQRILGDTTDCHLWLLDAHLEELAG